MEDRGAKPCEFIQAVPTYNPSHPVSNATFTGKTDVYHSDECYSDILILFLYKVLKVFLLMTLQSLSSMWRKLRNFNI